MTLPGLHAPVVDLRKLQDYVLSTSHPRGRHKAKVFRAALGLNERDAQWLKKAILRTVATATAVRESSDRWGERWRTDHEIVRQGRRAVVRCLWLLPAANDAPRLVTCYVLARQTETDA